MRQQIAEYDFVDMTAWLAYVEAEKAIEPIQRLAWEEAWASPPMNVVIRPPARFFRTDMVHVRGQLFKEAYFIREKPFVELTTFTRGVDADTKA